MKKKLGSECDLIIVLTISKKVLIVPIAIAVMGVLMMIFVDPIYIFVVTILPAWLTMFFLTSRSLRKGSEVRMRYVCQVCGEIHKGEKCPKCGSKSRRVQF